MKTKTIVYADIPYYFLDAVYLGDILEPFWDEINSGDPEAVTLYKITHLENILNSIAEACPENKKTVDKLIEDLRSLDVEYVNVSAEV